MFFEYVWKKWESRNYAYIGDVTSEEPPVKDRTETGCWIENTFAIKVAQNKEVIYINNSIQEEIKGWCIMM